MDAVRAVDGGVRVLVRAQPGAKRSEVVEIVAGQVRVRLAAPAVDGKANVELVRFLAHACGVRRAAVTIRRGATSRVKVVEIAGISLAEAAAAVGLRARSS